MKNTQLSVEELIQSLHALLEEMAEIPSEYATRLASVLHHYAPSARNLLDYLALRRFDIRDVQCSLADLGLSSIGRCESHVKENLESVLMVLYALKGEQFVERGKPLSIMDGERLLHLRKKELFGQPPLGRETYLMVTLPESAASDYPMVKRFLLNGMNVARINCAHDNELIWLRIIEQIKRGEHELNLKCKIMMDLAGPKLRTGPIEKGPSVAHWHTSRNFRGKVMEPAILNVGSGNKPETSPLPEISFILPKSFVDKMNEGDFLYFADLRGKARKLKITSKLPSHVVMETWQAAYVDELTEFTLIRDEEEIASTVASYIPAIEQQLRLKPGERLIIRRNCLVGTLPVYDNRGKLITPAVIGCGLEQIYQHVRRKQRIRLDDGKIEAEVTDSGEDYIEVVITHAKPSGTRLGAEKGINFPDADLDISGLTDKDISDLSFIAKHADLVALSFAQSVEDIVRLDHLLNQLDAPQKGVILKIETKRGFTELPNLLMAAMRRPVGVMIARGDLAVESEWERLAELQEQILWICEAAHVPVIWATQVLESMAKSGLPSRAEITDAAMSQRADCVMLNKGPYILDAIKMLNGILKRMENHQNKKTAMLRSLALMDE